MNCTRNKNCFTQWLSGRFGKPPGLVLLAFMLAWIPATRILACSDFMLPKASSAESADQEVVSVRTMDFDSTSLSYFVVVPRKIKWRGMVPKTWKIDMSFDRLGKSWTNQYGFIAVNIGGPSFLTSRMYIDGMNEHGLSACTLWLDDAKFPLKETQDKKNYPKLMSQLDIVSYILGMCKTVQDVLVLFDKSDPDIYVYQAKLGLYFFGWTVKDVSAPAHVVVHDADNNSIILEWLSETSFKPTIYTNSSDPPYPNAITNDSIANEFEQYYQKDYYKLLTPTNPYDYLVNRYNVGGGEVGLPGDSDDFSRWLRGHYLMPNAWPTKPDGFNCGEAPWRVIQALRAMGRNDRIYGESYNEDILSPYSFTEWTLARDHTNKVLYYHCMKNQQVKTLSLADYQSNFETKDKIRYDVPISTWYSATAGTDTGSRLNASISKVRGNKYLDVFIPVPKNQLEQAGHFYLYAHLANGLYANWAGHNWRFARHLRELKAFQSGPVQSTGFQVPLSDRDADWQGAKFYAGCGTSPADMFINSNNSLIRVVK